MAKMPQDQDTVPLMANDEPKMPKVDTVSKFDIEKGSLSSASTKSTCQTLAETVSAYASKRTALKGFLSCFCCFNIICLIVSIWLGWFLIDLRSQTSTLNIIDWTPQEFPRMASCDAQSTCPTGYKDDEALECYDGCPGAEFYRKFAAFNEHADFKKVEFPSRDGTPNGEPPVTIRAWWLPGRGKKAPRIVAVHGSTNNANHCGVQENCYILRTMGFACLTPSMRDYGDSDRSSHPTIRTWGYDNPYDILGAWDYAVNDPDGVLGGPLPPDQVGIMGFSKGAYESSIAFGLEPRVPGAWIDANPWLGLEGMIDVMIKRYASNGPLISYYLAPLLRKTIMASARHFSGSTPVDYYYPYGLLLNCSGRPKRDIAIVHSPLDENVPYELSNHAIQMVAGQKDCYDLMAWTPPEQCNGAAHHVEDQQFPEQSRTQLCKFWTKTFGKPESYCRLRSDSPLGQLADENQEAMEAYGGEFTYLSSDYSSYPKAE